MRLENALKTLTPKHMDYLHNNNVLQTLTITKPYNYDKWKEIEGKAVDLPLQKYYHDVLAIAGRHRIICPKSNAQA